MSPYDFNTFTAWNNVLGTFFSGSTTMVEHVLGGAVEGRTMVIKDNSPVLAGIYCILYIYIINKPYVYLYIHIYPLRIGTALGESQRKPIIIRCSNHLKSLGLVMKSPISLA